MKKIDLEFDNIIKNKEELLNQLESLKDEAIYMMRSPNHDEIFQKDLHALRIVINYINNADSFINTLKKWQKLLKMDGGNTKHQVLVDIEKLLEEYNESK